MEKINYKSELEFITEAFILAFFSTDVRNDIYHKLKSYDEKTIEDFFKMHDSSLLCLMRNLLKNNIDFVIDIINKSATSSEDKEEIIKRLKTLNSLANKGKEGI